MFSGGDILKYLDITLFFLTVLPLYVGNQYILVFEAQRAPTRSKLWLWDHTCCGVFSEKNYPPKAGPKDFRKRKEEEGEERKKGRITYQTDITSASPPAPIMYLPPPSSSSLAARRRKRP